MKGGGGGGAEIGGILDFIYPDSWCQQLWTFIKKNNLQACYFQLADFLNIYCSTSKCSIYLHTCHTPSPSRITKPQPLPSGQWIWQFKNNTTLDFLRLNKLPQWILGHSHEPDLKRGSKNFTIWVEEHQIHAFSLSLFCG